MIELSLIIINESQSTDDVEGRLNEIEGTEGSTCLGISSVKIGSQRLNIAAYDTSTAPPEGKTLKVTQTSNHATPTLEGHELVSLGACKLGTGEAQILLYRKK